MAKKGYGELIGRARESIGMKESDLAPRIGRTLSTVRRYESEESEPSVEIINALVAELPISAEQLLKAMGVNFNPSAASQLPPQLVRDWFRLHESEKAMFLHLIGKAAGTR